ncbi:secernin-1 [Nilaparvata lugens]|uniref:secernin-1 n=1 Tax=Nilaparvata lugens TaxID=108931 RepID=UPI00193E318F|nr:secernin-1 [Nilaparvata lugens]XP_039280947.1 secernin-1 [Nilaparvata lugens]
MKSIGSNVFVVLPPSTVHGAVIFGKNSDRPQNEVQEVIHVPGKSFSSGDKLECTYIEVPQVEATKAVILSKPSWMWGAEMGANEDGVVIGNQPVSTVVTDESPDEERLLGTDLVRLGLERSSSASEAVNVITSLLEEFGQGGPCSDYLSLSYHNSFLIADAKEVWVLETGGRLWAAECVTGGTRHISNRLSITTKIDRMSENLKQYAKDKLQWDEGTELNFSKLFSNANDEMACLSLDHRILEDKIAQVEKFSAENMFEILRDKKSSICKPSIDGDDFATTASHVSVILPKDSEKPSCHWFTGTPDPSLSVFKPFIFTPNVTISRHTISPTFDEDPAKVKPRFQKAVAREHNLYRLHRAAVIDKINVLNQLQEMEKSCVQDVEKFLDTFQPGQSLSEVDDLLKDVVETEVKFLK